MKEEQLKAIARHLTELYDRAETEPALKGNYHFSHHVLCGWCLEQLHYQKDNKTYHCINCSDALLIEQ